MVKTFFYTEVLNFLFLLVYIHAVLKLRFLASLFKMSLKKMYLLLRLQGGAFAHNFSPDRGFCMNLLARPWALCNFALV